MRVVWFKRDLRIHDHRPLRVCAHGGPFLALYIYEPRLMRSPSYGANQHAFINDCLEELREALQERGGRLLLAHGHARDVFAGIHRAMPISEIHSHMETGDALSYRRDKAVKRWCMDNRVRWLEAPINEVQRPHPDREGWSKRWYASVRAKPVTTPQHFESVKFVALPNASPILSAEELGVGVPAPRRQQGGRARGMKLLTRFIKEDPGGYPFRMSSPNTASEACSRLSPHLALGTLSSREVIHRLDVAKRLIRDPNARKGFEALESRLAWRGHFMQRFEDEMRIETHCLDPLVDRLRQPGHRHGRVMMSEAEVQRRYLAWTSGRTGFPMVDACIRSLRVTGWLSFRMRAMIVSTATYTLWLDWRLINPWLARQFTDYEPGIHLNQLQMQSGSTGMNELRIYNPVRQAQVHDPNGTFIRQWVPELSECPTEVLHALGGPKSSTLIQQYGLSYPGPIVDLLPANRAARATLTRLRSQPESRQAAQQNNQRLGSRRNHRRRSRGS